MVKRGTPLLFSCRISNNLLVFPAALAFFGICFGACMEWADPAAHHHGILRCRRVVLIQTQGKRNLITVNSPFVCGPLSDARPITTNTTSHHLQGPRVFRCAFMMKPFALKILLRNLRPVLLLTVPQSGAGWHQDQ